jgi:hypothetical protein
MNDECRKNTKRWLEEAVIGMNFCPFAASVYRTGQVRIVVSEVEDIGEAIQATIDEAVDLLETPDGEAVTSLVVFSEGLRDFERFLDAAETVRQALGRAGVDGVLQVATFHPDYQFAGTEPDDLGNYTNRAPYPILHLLPEALVTEAVDSHPDPEGIPDENIERLRRMGRQEVEAMWAEFSPPEPR